MPLNPLSPAPMTWRIAAMTPERDQLILHLKPLRSTVTCPVCGTFSTRVHRRYRRQPWDVPWGRWPVRLVVHARRFFCDASTCPRRILVEPFPGVLAPYARQTERRQQAMLALAHASRAEMAARVAGWLGYRASPDTLIRRQHAERFACPSPQVLGVDEFARRRGSTYATLLVDLERHQPVAVLEGRTAEPLRKWLQAPPLVRVLVRDRANAYAMAGRQAVPDALQVADRFHLGQNVSDALKTLLHSRRWHQPTTAAQPLEVSLASTATPTPSADAPHGPQPTPRKRAVWEAIQPYRDLGHSLRQIAQAVGRDRRTVRRYLAADQPPVYPARRPRLTQLTPHTEDLAARWAQGYQNARLLYDELVQRGYRGSASMVRRLVRPWRTCPEASPRARTPSQLSRLMLQPASHLTAMDRDPLTAFLQVNPWLAQGYELNTRFQALLAERDLPALEPWLQAAEISELPSFHAVARSFRQDIDAIQAALTTPWSTSPCEGQISRVKLIKRLGYRRAKLDHPS